MKSIVGIGEVLWDVLPTGKQAGGAPMNFAFHASQQGFHGSIISALGDDELGRELADNIKQLGLTVDTLPVVSYPTGTVDVRLDNRGVPEYRICEGVAWDHIPCTPLLRSTVAAADAVCWGSLAQRSEESHHSIMQLVGEAKADAMKVFDINLRLKYYSREVIESSLHAANVLKINDDELPVLAKMYAIGGTADDQLAALLHKYALRYVIYTMGATGSTIIDNSGNKSYIATPKVKVVDTVGAGDSFTATFVARTLQGDSLQAAHAKAVEVAAFVCTRKGATPRHAEQPTF